MPKRADRIQEIGKVVSVLLRTGVLISAFCVLAGGLHYLAIYGTSAPHYGIFNGEPAELRSITVIVRDAFSNGSRGLIQFGLVVLMLTPLAWVGFLFFAFLRQRDGTYAIITAIVLAALLYSLLA